MSILEKAATRSDDVSTAPPAPATVLVIDDDPAVCAALQAMLTADGHAVVTSVSAKEGVEQAHHQQFDLAMVDLMMPEMDGLQTMAALKRADALLQIIGLTGYPSVETSVAAFKQGACDYLQKPFTMARIRLAMTQALDPQRRNSLPCREMVREELPCACTHNVTLRKEAQRALEECQGKLQAIFDGVEAGILIIDPDTHCIVDANPQALELIGVRREKVVGSVCHHFVCPAEVGRCPVTDLHLKVDNSERILLTAKKERLAIIKTVRPVVIAGRNYLVESFVNITERKKAESDLLLYSQELEGARAVEEQHTQKLARLVEELAQEQVMLRILMDNVPDAIYFKDSQCRFTRINAAHSRLLGVGSSAEAIGKTDLDFFPAEDAQRYLATERRIVETGEPLIGSLERIGTPRESLAGCPTRKFR